VIALAAAREEVGSTLGAVERVAYPARSLSVIIPAYNEERRLPGSVERIHRYLLEKRYDAEIIVVDDGSRDRTTQFMHALQPSLPLLRVLTHKTNTGKDYAVLAGVRIARKSSILMTDADLSTPIEDLARLWPFYDRGYSLVVGSRRHRDSRILVPQPLYRRFVGRVFNRLVSLTCVRGLRDTQCGFKLFDREAILRILPELRTKGFAFDVEILMRGRDLGFKIAEVGVTWSNSPDTRMKVLGHGSRMFRQLLQMKGLW